MKPTVVITVIAAVLAIAAGIAIAGLPSTTPGADVVVLDVPTTETQPVASLPTVTAQPLESTTTEAPAPLPTRAITTTEPSAPDTTTSSTTTTELDDGPADELRDRDELAVATGNATDLSGIAGAHADVLEAKGYVDVLKVDALQAAAISRIYHLPGFELEAARLAADLNWDLLVLSPMSELPALTTERQLDLVALIGLDRT